MTSYNLSKNFTLRRQLLKGATLGVGAALLPTSLFAQQALQQALTSASQSEIKAIVDAFLQGAEPQEKGMRLDMQALGDNPSAVPVKVVFENTPTPESYCEELIIIAEGNPRPLACRFNFSPLSGTTEVAVRLRLIESQTIQAYARMNDGSFLSARHRITVTAGGCGM